MDFLGRLEAKIREQRQRLEGIVEVAQLQALEADSAARAKTDFIAHMSHEPRTTLNANLGFPKTIRDTRLGPIDTEAYRDCSCHTYESGEHLPSLIDDLLIMSRIESGKVELDNGDRHVSQLVDECLALVASAAASKDVTLDISAIERNICVSGDRKAVKQVMITLLSNAVKFTSQQGRIDIDAAINDESLLTITVTHSGVGTNTRDTGRVLEPLISLK